MPMNHSGDLMQALVAKLYSILTGDDDAIKTPRNKFVSWFLPGVPFDTGDFKYCAKGFVGETAEEIQELYHQAFVLSKLFDYIPDVSNQFVTDQMQQTMYAGTQDTISSVYNDVLKYSRVVHKDLSDKEKEKLQKFRDLLTIEVEEVDILTDEKKKVSKPGKLTVAYNDFMNRYFEAVNQYQNLKIDAMAASGDSPEAKRRVLDFTNKGPNYIIRLNSAWADWGAMGYRDEYNTITAYINQVTQRNLVLYKADLENKFRSAKLSSPTDGAFYYTTVLPGHFATSAGWTRFTFIEQDGETHYKKKTSEVKVDASLNFGLFSVGPSGGGSKIKVNEDAKSENFSAEFEFTQVPICRPWFEPGFFSMRSWTLDDNWNLSYDNKPVSEKDQDGKRFGRLVAYPVSALFVRNVRLTSSNMSQHADYVKTSIQAGGSVGYGPFRLGGSYKSGKEERNTNFHMDADTLSIDGMQLVGFINNYIPKCPNLHPDIKPEDLVGGD